MSHSLSPLVTSARKAWAEPGKSMTFEHCDCGSHFLFQVEKIQRNRFLSRADHGACTSIPGLELGAQLPKIRFASTARQLS